MGLTEPKTARGKATRERIVLAAAALVAEEGAAGMSLDDLCKRARASRGQLYHYFDDRDDLVRAVVRVTAESVIGGQARYLDRLDTWAGIEAWFDHLVSVQESLEAHGGCPIGSLVGQLAEHDDQARIALARAFDRWEGHLADGLSRMRARGGLTPDADPGRMAAATMSSLQGGLLLTQVHRDPERLRMALDGALAMLRGSAARALVD